MQSAENWWAENVPDPIDCARERRIFIATEMHCPRVIRMGMRDQDRVDLRRLDFSGREVLE